MRIRWMKLFTALLMAALTAVLPVCSIAAQGTEPAQQQEGEGAQPEGEEDVPAAPEEAAAEDGAQPEAVNAAEDEAEAGDGGEVEAGEAPKLFSEALAKLKIGGHDPYMSGSTGGRFKPDSPMTRAEAAQVIYNLLAEKPENAAASFPDVSSSYWGYKAISAMSALGVMNGSDGRFKPENYLTRAEFMSVLSKCFDLPEAECDFTDVPETHWAYGAIAAVQNKGWISGYGDGRFGPDDKITRSQVVVVLNSALERRGDGFAADRDKQKFTDVPKTHWAFLDITEAADPPETPDPPPTTDPDTGFKVGATVQVTADTGLNIRRAPINGAVITAVPNGTLLTITNLTNPAWPGVKTSGGVSGYASAEYLKLYSGGGTSQSGTLSAKSLTMSQFMSARLDATASSNVDTMKWTSSDPDVAKVGYTIAYSKTKQSAIVYAGSPGTAVLTYSDGAGNKKGTCTVTVTAPEPVRFAYPSESIVQKGSQVELKAITDSSRDEVRFDIVSGPWGGSYTTNTYAAESQRSGHGLPANDTRVFSRKVQLGASGTYTIRAYSAKDGAYSSGYRDFTVQVKDSFSYTEATLEARRLSSLGIREIKNFEGTVHEVEDDRLVSGNPTVGCGYVVASANETFYNNLTDTEAYALLAEKANEGVYAKAVENFRKKHNIKMSQAQFDALTSWVYNIGTGYLAQGESDAANMILNMVAPPTVSAGKPASGTINTSSSSNPAVLYASTDTNSTKQTTIPRGTAVKITEVKVIRSKTVQQVWYKTSYNGKTGWVGSGYVKLSGSYQVDLNYADSTSLATELLLWHMAGGAVTPGLVYRRLAECKMFFFGNYDEGNSAAAGDRYRKNTYGFVYPARCAYLDRR